MEDDSEPLGWIPWQDFAEQAEPEKLPSLPAFLRQFRGSADSILSTAVAAQKALSGRPGGPTLLEIITAVARTADGLAPLESILRSLLPKKPRGRPPVAAEAERLLRFRRILQRHWDEPLSDSSLYWRPYLNTALCQARDLVAMNRCTKPEALDLAARTLTRTVQEELDPGSSNAGHLDSDSNPDRLRTAIQEATSAAESARKSARRKPPLPHRDHKGKGNNRR